MLLIPIVLVILVIYILSFYNRLKTADVQITASIQEIGNQLKRQADLIPNLLESAKAYLKHEKDIFTQLTDARKAIGANNIEKSQELITKALGAIKVIVESNPEMKGANVIGDMMNELRDTADKIMYSRRTFIDLTADYNSAIVTFPNSLLANLFKFTQKEGLKTPSTGEFLNVNSEDIKNPKIKY